MPATPRRRTRTPQEQQAEYLAEQNFADQRGRFADNAANETPQQRSDVLSNFVCNPNGRIDEVYASTPQLRRDGQLTDRMLQILAALEYMYYSMKPCVRRMNVLWNRRRHWDDARRREALRVGVSALPLSPSAINLVREFHSQYDAFVRTNSEASNSWGRNFYSECDTMLQALPATGFNWAVFFGSFIPREVRNSSTDRHDATDLLHIADVGTCDGLRSQGQNNE